MPDDQRARGQHPSGAVFCQRCGSAAELRVTRNGGWVFLRPRVEAMCRPCFLVAYAQAERFGVNIAVGPL